MNTKKGSFDFVTVSLVVVTTLVAVAIVTYLWSGADVVDWQISSCFAVIFGIVLPWARSPERKKKGK